MCVHQVYAESSLERSRPLSYRLCGATTGLRHRCRVERAVRSEFPGLAEGADLLIHDAQYTIEDYQQTKHGYGHSTVEMATSAASIAGVGQLILFHHEPTYDDAQLDAMEALARTQFAHTRSAYEGMEIDLLALRTNKWDS